MTENIFESESVAVSPLSVQKGKIENLSDKPNLRTSYGGDGMTASDLKRAFDVIGVYLATRLSNLLSALKSEEAGGSLGIKGWQNEKTTIKAMLDVLKTSGGAAILGTGKTSGEDNMTLQEVIDDLYRLIASYKLDDIYDIKTTLGYSSKTGICENYLALETLVTTLKETLDCVESILNVNAAKSASVRLNNIESDLAEIDGMLGSASGIATLDLGGKLSQNVDASKIVSGKLPLSVIPDAAFERTKIVSSEGEMYALTYEDVQNGDLVVIRKSGSPDKWFKVVDDEKLSSKEGYMEIIGGTTAVAQMAKEFDENYSGANSIAEKFRSIEGAGRTTESVKKNADDISSLSLALNSLKGGGYTSGSVAENKEAIDALSEELSKEKAKITLLSSQKADKSAARLLSATHAKSGTVHTFTLENSEFLSGVSEYLVKAKMTADISAGDTFTITDGSVTYSGILPVSYDGESYAAEFSSGVYPVVIFGLDVGGSEKHAFFKSGGAFKGRYASGTLTADDLYIPETGLMRNYLAIPAELSFTPRIVYLHGINAKSTMTDINATRSTFTLTDVSAVWEKAKNISVSSNATLSLKNAPYEWWTIPSSEYWDTHDKGPLSGTWEAFE